MFYHTFVHSLVAFTALFIRPAVNFRGVNIRNYFFLQIHSNSARISSLADVLLGPELLPLEGGVFRSWGSK